MRCLLLLLLAVPISLWAQPEGSTAPVRTTLPKFTLKINPGALINTFQQSVAVASDIRVNQKVTADIGLGYYFSAIPMADNVDESYTGGRYRAGFNYHFSQGAKVSYYIGTELKYNDIQHKSYKNMLRQGGQYEETALVRRDIKVYGINARMGLQYFYGENLRFMLEPFLGFGWKQRVITMHLPEDAVLSGNRWVSFERLPGTYPMPDILFGVHWGVVFW